MKNTGIYIHHLRNLTRTIEQRKTSAGHNELVGVLIAMMCLTDRHGCISYSVIHIILLCPCFQVVGIDAMPMSALVSHNQSIGYRSFVEQMRDAVRPNQSAMRS